MGVAPELAVSLGVFGDALTLRAMEHAEAAYWLFSASHCAISSWWSGSTCPVRLKCRIALLSVIDTLHAYTHIVVCKVFPEV